MNNKTGKVKEVLFEDIIEEDHRTGIQTISNKKITVWADKNLKTIINSVDGVSSVFVDPNYPTTYLVYLDPRYSKDFVIAEIEAVILTKPE